VSHCGEGARGDRREGDGGDNKSLPPPERRYTCKMIEEFAKRGIGPPPKDFISILGNPFMKYFRGSVIFSFATKEITDKVFEKIKPYLEKLYNEGVIKSAEGEKKETTQTQ